jgi:biopolymer transport protein ExbB/TolQ
MTDSLTIETLKGLRDDIGGLRGDIGRVHEKLDIIDDKRREAEKDTELRLQALEIERSNRPPQLERPCKELVNHIGWHETKTKMEMEEEKEKREYAITRKARILAVIVRMAPWVISVVCGMLGLKLGETLF